LLPDDMDDFTIRQAVEVDVVQILETMQSSRSLPIHQVSPGDNIESGIACIDLSDAPLSDEFSCPDHYFDTSDDQIRCDSVSIMMLLKHLTCTRLRYLSMFRSYRKSLTANRCLDLIASEISSLKSLFPHLRCLLRHFSVRYFKFVAQNSYWCQTNDAHSGWNDHSWILRSRPGYYSLNSSWLIAFIVNTIFINHHNLIWSMR
jgi:hypothetical protein